MNDCLFCKIIAHEIPCDMVYEDETCMSFLDIHPVNKGHVLIVPKQHCLGSHDADPEVLSKLMLAIQKIAQAMMNATTAPAYNIFQNNGIEAGQVIPHLHFHLIPRFAHDGHLQWHGNVEYSQGEAKEIAGRIKNYF
ncbi:HIT family protein [Candidatus Uhrbacteria bacterium]|nr:HIT family protein [Candidatus Uhrbacteria bacterium]